jgi:hypothetical protein
MVARLIFERLGRLSNNDEKYDSVIGSTSVWVDEIQLGTSADGRKKDAVDVGPRKSDEVENPKEGGCGRLEKLNPSDVDAVRLVMGACEDVLWVEAVIAPTGEAVVDTWLVPD